MEVSATIFSFYGEMDFHFIELSETFYFFNASAISCLGVMYFPLSSLSLFILTYLKNSASDATRYALKRLVLRFSVVSPIASFLSKFIFTCWLKVSILDSMLLMYFSKIVRFPLRQDTVACIPMNAF